MGVIGVPGPNSQMVNQHHVKAKADNPSGYIAEMKGWRMGRETSLGSTQVVTNILIAGT